MLSVSLNVAGKQNCVLTSLARIPKRQERLLPRVKNVHESTTHVSEVPIQNFDVSVDDLQRHQLVVPLSNSGDEEK